MQIERTMAQHYATDAARRQKRFALHLLTPVWNGHRPSATVQESQTQVTLDPAP